MSREINSLHFSGQVWIAPTFNLLQIPTLKRDRFKGGRSFFHFLLFWHLIPKGDAS
jgi:hypothetical protein